MSRFRKGGRIHLVAMLVTGLFLCRWVIAVEAQERSDLSTFVGRWQIDLSRTHMNRGNHIARSDTFTLVFERASTGLTLHIYAEYPQAAPTRSSSIIPDHQVRTCEIDTGCLTVGGNASEQSYSYYQISSHLLMRVFYIRGEANEYSTYSVSSDGKTFTMIAWGAGAPDRQNIQVFDKQPNAVLDMTGLYRPRSAEPFMAVVDTNHDGLASEPEWIAAGLKMDSFLAIQWFNDSISKLRLLHHPFPPESLDPNGDLTVAGMKAYDGLLHGFGEVSAHPNGVDKMVSELDTNRDGKVTLEEWKASGLSPVVFKSLDKRSEGKGFLVSQDILSATFTDMMLQSDGSLTVESMKAYDARRHPGHPDNER